MRGLTAAPQPLFRRCWSNAVRWFMSTRPGMTTHTPLSPYTYYNADRLSGLYRTSYIMLLQNSVLEGFRHSYEPVFFCEEICVSFRFQLCSQCPDLFSHDVRCLLSLSLFLFSSRGLCVSLSLTCTTGQRRKDRGKNKQQDKHDWEQEPCVFIWILWRGTYIHTRARCGTKCNFNLMQNWRCRENRAAVHEYMCVYVCVSHLIRKVVA